MTDGKEEGVFIIRKTDGNQHVINFGQNSPQQMPSCSCKDWIRWHIPCKHFFAVFRLTQEWNWEALPQTYRDSAYLSTDSQATDKYFSQFTSVPSLVAPSPAADDESHSSSPSPAADDESHSSSPIPAADDELHSSSPSPAADDESHLSSPSPVHGCTSLQEQIPVKVGVQSVLACTMQDM